MANYIKNVLKMDDIAHFPLYRLDEHNNICFDFNSLIPMPQELHIEAGGCQTDAINAVIAKVRGLNIKPGTYAAQQMPEQELLDLGLRYITNTVRYGAPTWYEWCIRNWGTKWNAVETKIEGDDTVSFWTANTAPIPILEALGERYPDISIEHWWADEDIGQNSGYYYHDVDGDSFERFNSDSQEAFETYNLCWGADERLVKENGIWRRIDND